MAIPSDEGERIVRTSKMLSERWKETVKCASEDFEGWMRRWWLLVVGNRHCYVNGSSR
jgi:hypothetical protein